MQEKETLSEEEYVEEEERRRREKKAEKKEKLEAIPIKRKPEATPPRKEKQVPIPFIKLKVTSKPELKKLEVDEEIPKIEKEKREISVPFMELQKPSLSLRRYKLDSELLRVERTKRILRIPIIRVTPSPKVTASVIEFDEKIIKSKPIPLRRIRVPIYRKSIFISPKFTVERFDLMINEQLRKHLEKIEEETRTALPREKAEVARVEVAVPSLGGGEEVEVPELFDILFSTSGKGRIGSGDPKVIGLKELEGDEHIGALRTLCMRIYREKVGGKPKPIIISKIKKEMFKREVEKWMEAEDRIFSVGLEETERLDKDFWDSVQDRIEGLFSQRFGFIIFNKQVMFFPKHHIVNIINVEPKRMTPELKKEIASMIWGFVRLDDVGFHDFDHIFEVARKKFESKLRSIGEPYLSATKRHKGLHESDYLHYPIKLFLVKYLANQMNLRSLDQIKEIIRTEEEYGDFVEEKRPDIYVSSTVEKFTNQVFEVETLFGQGDYPLKKIDETVEKYEKVSAAPSKINVVLDNLTFLRHINGLRKKLNLHRSLKMKGKRDFDLEFYTLDLRNKKLVSLANFIKHLNGVLRSG